MTDSETKHAIRMILLSASLAGMSYISFQNGLLLSYFSHLKVPSASILILLSILPISLFFFIIPFSYLSDKLGKKFIGNIGLIKGTNPPDNALSYDVRKGLVETLNLFLNNKDKAYFCASGICPGL